MNAPHSTHDQAEQAAYERLDKLCGVHNVKTYRQRLEQKRTNEYRVLPDGTVDFVRKP